MTCLYILDSYEHLISDSCNTGDCAVTLDSFSLTVCIISPWQSSSPGEPGNRGDDSSSSHVAAGLIRCDMNSDVCRNRKSCSSFFSSRRAWMLFYTCWYCGFVQMRAALIQIQTTISWSDSGLKTASRRNKTNRTSSLTNDPADTHLLLGDEGGALTVHGVIGEVVREGFGSIPRRLSCDAFRELLGNQRKKKLKRTHVEPELQSEWHVEERSTFRLVMEVLFPSILMMHFAVKSFSLWEIKNDILIMFPRYTGNISVKHLVQDLIRWVWRFLSEP